MEDIKKNKEELLEEARIIASQHGELKIVILKMLDDLDALEIKQQKIFEQIKGK